MRQAPCSSSKPELLSDRDSLCALVADQHSNRSLTALAVKVTTYDFTTVSFYRALETMRENLNHCQTLGFIEPVLLHFAGYLIFSGLFWNSRKKLAFATIRIVSSGPKKGSALNLVNFITVFLKKTDFLGRLIIFYFIVASVKFYLFLRFSKPQNLNEMGCETAPQWIRVHIKGCSRVCGIVLRTSFWAL